MTKMNTTRSSLSALLQKGLLLLLAISILFWLVQALLFFFAFLLGGWDGIKNLASHLIISNTDPFQFNRWDWKDFVISELSLLGVTLALLIANLQSLVKFIGMLKGKKPKSALIDNSDL